MKKVFKKEDIKKVIAVIVTYNRKEILKECVEAILNQNYENCDILIVDNASTDGTGEYISNLLKIKRVIYRNTGENLGGAGGFNYGMKEAVKLGYDYLWIMDDDCISHKDTLEEFLKADKKLKGDYGFLASKVLWKDNSLCVMNKQKKTFSKWLKDFDTNYQAIEMSSFVSMFIKSSTIRKYGLPIKEFFIWTDDWEFSRRISRKEKCYFISSSVVTHKCKENIGASIDTVDGDRLGRFKYLYRNDVVLYRGEGIKGLFLLKLRIMLHKLRVYKSPKKDKKERIKIINQALKEGKKFYPEIEYITQHKTKQVLQVFGEPFSNGGQEAFIMNMYNSINKEKVQFHFFTPYYCDNKHYQNKIMESGGKIFFFNKSFNKFVRKINFKVQFKKFLKTSYYDTIHIHSGSTYVLAAGAKIAKKYNVKKVIVHSHIAGVSKIKSIILKILFSKKLLKNVDFYCACSQKAAEFKFPSKVINSKNYMVINNGIDTEKFAYNEKVRESYRREFNLEDCFVIGNVGRMESQKNQSFLIDVFEIIIKKKEQSRLVLVGTGSLEKKLKDKVFEKNIEEKVIFLKNRNDVYNLLQAMDVFAFPSIFEGLGIVAVEAQAAGLITISSEYIPKEANLTKLFKRVNISEGPERWANEILKYSNYERKNTSSVITKKGYNSNESALRLEKLYVEGDVCK